MTDHAGTENASAEDAAGKNPGERIAELRRRERQAVAYVRAKVNQLLEVMGTAPLRPEELDDETLFALDPLGIIGESFAQVIEHLNRTNRDLVMARDEIRAMFDSAGAAVLLVDREGRIEDNNVRSRELFSPDRPLTGRFCSEVLCGQSSPPQNCLLRRIRQSRTRCEEHDFSAVDRYFHVVGTPLLDDCGEVAQAILVYTDLTQRRRMEQSLRETRERLQTILSSVQAGILLIDAETHRIVDANDKALAMIAAPREAVLGAECHDFVCPARCGECPITDLGLEVDHAERTLLQAGGASLPVLKTVTAITLDGRRHLLESFLDISERKAAEAALQESEARYRSLYAHMREGVSLNELVLDSRGRPVDFRVLDANPAYARLFESSPRDLVGRLGTELFGELGTAHLDIFHGVVQSGKAVDFECDCTVLGREFQVSVFMPGPDRFAAVFDDITERKRAEREMERLAYFDHLTGLPNRSLFRDRLEQALALATRTGQQVALMFLDLDQFKEINDTFGHASGDELLQMIAGRLSESVRKSDTVARLGGDEFVVILTGIDSEQDAGQAGRHLLAALSEPIVVGGREIFVTGSLGIALFPHDGEKAEDLITNADAAMYRAKEQGNTCQFYAASMNTQALERLLLSNDLRRALERDEFFLLYQPQVDVATGRVFGVEALLRWRHPDLGLLPPAQFIPLAEETGLILPLGLWVLETACVQARAWQEAGLPPIVVALNISGRQFHEPDLAGTIAGILESSGLEGGSLELELTETMLMTDAERTRKVLETLKAMGIRLAIDDFGTGYSSLNYLKHFPIDRLKIDRSFIHDLPRDPDDGAIAEAIIALAGSLGLEVLAEGVETEQQLEFLQSRGCRKMQGYYFGRPESAETLAEILRRGPDPRFSPPGADTGSASAACTPPGE